MFNGEGHRQTALLLQPILAEQNENLLSTSRFSVLFQYWIGSGCAIASRSTPFSSSVSGYSEEPPLIGLM